MADAMNDTRASRDTRANEAIAMKDRQIGLLQEQTSQLLRSLDKVGEDAAQLHMAKLAAEEASDATAFAWCLAGGRVARCALLSV
jgi:hypothetical protein